MINIETLLEVIDCEKNDLEVALDQLELKYENLFYGQSVDGEFPKFFQDATDIYSQQLRLAYYHEVSEAYENFLNSLTNINLSHYSDN